jgi:hypothetical protein
MRARGWAESGETYESGRSRIGVIVAGLGYQTVLRALGALRLDRLGWHDAGLRLYSCRCRGRSTVNRWGSWWEIWRR